MRNLNHHLFALAAVTALAACNGHPVDRIDNVVTAVNREENALPAKTKLDMLFLVDNSGSMCQEQANLTRNFRAISDFLFNQLGDAADYRIAVVSTDMQTDGQKGRFLNSPAAPEPSLNCKDANGDPLVPNTADCPGDLPQILKSSEVQSLDDLERRFRCMATLGTNGDGFEKGLEAVRLSLSCRGPNRDKFSQCCNEDGTYDPACIIPPNTPEPEFLRPDALLVVVFITDEPDCSDPAVNPAESRRVICKYGSGDGNGDGVPDGYQDAELCGDRSPAECFRAECSDLDAEACRVERCIVSRAANSNCEWFRGNLTPVEDYYRFLTGLKAQPLESIVVASIVGRRSFTEAGNEITYNPGNPSPECAGDPDNGVGAPTTEACCPGGACRGEIQTTCDSANGQAFSGRRYLELTERFGENGIGCPAGVDQDDPTTCMNICVDDFREPLLQLQRKIIKVIGSYCLDKPAACVVPASADSAERPCESDEEFANTANYQIRVRQQCLRTVNDCDPDGTNCGTCEQTIPPFIVAEDKWDLVMEPSCPGGMLVQLAELPEAGSEVFVEFRVSLDPPRQGAAPADAGAPATDAGN